MTARICLVALPAILAACQSPAADERSTAPFSGIAESETIRFTGTEPFWGGEAKGESLTYSTPENPDGTTITVSRFAGNSGLGLSGTMEGAKFDLVVTLGECSDGMSDRTYPFTVTLQLGEETRTGCAWTSAHPFTGPENP
ncbi:MAG: hypothetical protein KJZ64_10655 [Sphingomonadaceae bacterium]|nr:hypothetical protein [Sphingomonadaceae bacterium]